MKKENNQGALILGVMSGTSLDGLDLALCEFSPDKDKFQFHIKAAKTFNYPEIWKQRLSSIRDASAEKYFAMNELYGRYIAEKVNSFLADKEKPRAVASHGHTVFHQPQAGFTAQIGCGATIAANTGLTTISDFRSLDVAHGGQGAPLVPIGDRLLFGQYQACLNLGGIANISYDNKQGERVAYDVCVTNMLLNYLAETRGEAYDAGGDMARKGKVDQAFLAKLDALAFYSQEGAKSIGREWFEKHLLPLFENSPLSLHDQLATATEHIAGVLSRTLDAHKIKNVLLTGGGAFNDFLVERVRARTGCEIILPSEEIVNFKEALIFALLGFLRLNETVNILSSVTGARTESCGGAVYLGNIH
jgi:anhydro-N-acetylmuramic acid kinase